MIPRYRNRGIFQLVCAIVLTAGLVVLTLKLRKTYHPNAGWLVVGVLLYIGAYIMWVRSGFSFVRAKGYPRDHAGQLFMVLMIFAFCVPIVAYILPIIALCLDDRSGKKKR